MPLYCQPIPGFIFIIHKVLTQNIFTKYKGIKGGYNFRHAEGEAGRLYFGGIKNNGKDLVLEGKQGWLHLLVVQLSKCIIRVLYQCKCFCYIRRAARLLYSYITTNDLLTIPAKNQNLLYLQYKSSKIAWLSYILRSAVIILLCKVPMIQLTSKLIQFVFHSRKASQQYREDFSYISA